MREHRWLGGWLSLLGLGCTTVPVGRPPVVEPAPPATASASPSPPTPDGGPGLPAVILAPPDGVYPGVEPVPPQSVVLQYTAPERQYPRSTSPDVGDLPETPLAARFTPFPVPKTRSIGVIAGTGPTDVWLVDEQLALLHYDGSRLRARGRLCPDDGLYGPFADALRLHVRERELVVLGELFTGTTPDPAVAVVPRSLPRQCDFHGGNSFAVASLDDSVWWWDDAGLHSRSGERLPAPLGNDGEPPRSVATIWLESARHAWAATGTCPRPAAGCRAALWEYRGVAWLPRPPVDLAPVQLWADDRDRLWLLGLESVDAARWSLAVLDAGEWTRVATPASFGSVRLVGRHATEVWFYGGQRLFVSDGSVVREVATPLERVETAWIESGGPLWIGGTEPDGAEDRGAVYRLSEVPR